MATFPAYLDIDYTDGENEEPNDYPTLDAKIDKAIEITHVALKEYRNPAVMWTGGKDSTLVLYFVREVAREFDLDLPPVVFIDHFEHFPDVIAFVEHWADEWDLDLHFARNKEFAHLGAGPGDEIPIDILGEETQHELRERLGYEGETFRFSADSYEGNHLLKTVALNEIIQGEVFDGIFSGVRWDEQEARAGETFFSSRHDSEKYPPHDRVHSILQFDERAVWDAMWNDVVPDAVENYPAGHVPQDYEDLPRTVEPEDLPVSPKYFEGFRSLGSEKGSEKSAEQPAWLQDLDGTTERAGRAQDKEDLMGRLRDLGYM
jgi:phosphoadenosine phosphosulfate reductase